MTDQDALLAAIIHSPNDNTPRLIYADWLEENDRAEEAEFLRVECRLSGMEPGDPEYPELLNREQELRLWLTTHVQGPKPTFSGGLSVDEGSQWWYWTQRGFPRFLEFDGWQRPGVRAIRALVNGLTRAFNVLPTRWLVVRSITISQLASLLKQPMLAELSELTIQLGCGPAEADDAARLVANCRHLRNLRGLSLAFSFTDAGCEALVDAPWAGLQWFSPEVSGVGVNGIRALAGAEWFQNLRELTLDDSLSSACFATLAGLPPFPRLHTLDLSRNGFSEDSWETFSTTRSFPALKRLQLTEGDMSGARIDFLTQTRGFALAELDLKGSGCRQKRTGAALAAAPWAGSLQILDLDMNGLAASDTRAIAACKKFGNLRHLVLSDNKLGITTLRALAANPALRKLIVLGLAFPPPRIGDLTSSHFDEFLAKLTMPELRYLNLSGYPLGAKATRRLSDPKFGSLRRLGLDWCNLSESAVETLLEAPALQDLIQLDLKGNELHSSPQLLLNRAVLPRLASCTLTQNSIPASLATKLRRRPGIRV